MIHNHKQQLEKPLSSSAQKNQLFSIDKNKNGLPKYKSSLNYLDSYIPNNINILKKNTLSQEKEKLNNRRKKLKIKLNIENKNDTPIHVNKCKDFSKLPLYQNQKSEALVFPKILSNKINNNIAISPELKKEKNLYSITKSNSNIIDSYINKELIKKPILLKPLSVSKISSKKPKLFASIINKNIENINKKNKYINDNSDDEDNMNEDNKYEKHKKLKKKINKIDKSLNNLTNFFDENKNNLQNNNNNDNNIYDNNINNFPNIKLPEILSTQIFNKTFNNFTESIFSSFDEFKKTDIISAYAYNTNCGNIKYYNEDTITVKKIFINEYEYFYFFAIYDGHGGSGCSSYLQSNLHKNIKEFSIDGIKNAIKFTEEEFLKKYAIDNDEKLIDESGSCACIALIKKKN